MSDRYWKAGLPVTSAMAPQPSDLCDFCGHCRDRHRLVSTRLGIPCTVPRCTCQRANGYRRAVGPNIVEQHTSDGVATILHQPAPPMTGYRG
jgi:hypothetical protein